MSILAWTYIMVILSFGLYIFIAWRSRVKETKGFYVAGSSVPPLANGMATAADWMSAASFISMAGLVSFMGYAGTVYLMGWTGGYVLLALLLAPYLRKFGKFTVPDFVGDRYYSSTARIVALICAIFVSLTYVAGQMRGAGIVFSRFLEVEVSTGVVIGMAVVFFYAALGGMKGITWTQVAQYCVLIVAFILAAAAISYKLTGMPVPQLGFGSTLIEGERAGQYVLQAIDGIHEDLGLHRYTEAFHPGGMGMLSVVSITLALMVGTAGLPHVIIRFFTVPSVKAARISAFWALLFIALLYTTAPTVAGFARYNMIDTINDTPYTEAPSWFKNWEQTGLVAWVDKAGDGIIRFRDGDPFVGSPDLTGERGEHGERLVSNELTDNDNELYIDRDIIVLASPEMGNLPAWMVGLVAAGGLAAALSTASGLLIVIASSISHDLYYRILNPQATERQRMAVGRIMIAIAVLIAGYFGINPPGFVAEVVAFAFGLAASSFFPIIILGIFTTWVNREGAIAGMIAGISFTMMYIIQTKFMGMDPWFFGIVPEGIGTVGMLINAAVTLIVSSFTKSPPAHIRELVQNVRTPRGSGEAKGH